MQSASSDLGKYAQTCSFVHMGVLVLSVQANLSVLYQGGRDRGEVGVRGRGGGTKLIPTFQARSFSFYCTVWIHRYLCLVLSVFNVLCRFSECLHKL